MEAARGRGPVRGANNVGPAQAELLYELIGLETGGGSLASVFAAEHPEQFDEVLARLRRLHARTRSTRTSPGRSAASGGGGSPSPAPPSSVRPTVLRVLLRLRRGARLRGRRWQLLSMLQTQKLRSS
jgi:hypothetical protein